MLLVTFNSEQHSLNQDFSQLENANMQSASILLVLIFLLKKKNDVDFMYIK